MSDAETIQSTNPCFSTIFLPKIESTYDNIKAPGFDLRVQGGLIVVLLSAPSVYLFPVYPLRFPFLAPSVSLLCTAVCHTVRSTFKQKQPLLLLLSPPPAAAPCFPSNHRCFTFIFCAFKLLQCP